MNVVVFVLLIFGATPPENLRIPDAYVFEDELKCEQAASLIHLRAERQGREIYTLCMRRKVE